MDDSSAAVKSAAVKCAALKRKARREAGLCQVSGAAARSYCAWRNRPDRPGAAGSAGRRGARAAGAGRIGRLALDDRGELGADALREVARDAALPDVGRLEQFARRRSGRRRAASCRCRNCRRWRWRSGPPRKTRLRVGKAASFSRSARRGTSAKVSSSTVLMISSCRSGFFWISCCFSAAGRLRQDLVEILGGLDRGDRGARGLEVRIGDVLCGEGRRGERRGSRRPRRLKRCGERGWSKS